VLLSAATVTGTVLPAEAQTQVPGAAAQSGLEAGAATAPIDGPPPPVPPATLARDGDGRATMRAVRISQDLRIDGALDEAVYAATPPVEGFIQQLPKAGAPATERTEVWILYDTQNVYVVARCWDSAPESEWVANDMRRDAFSVIFNDNFSVAFDTFYDRRNGVAFMVNPIAGFFDYQITDEGNPNSDWNPVWNVKTGRFDGGWTVEMAIPFKSLRYTPGTSQIWGIQFGRRVARKNEMSYLTPVSIAAGPGLFRLSAAGTLVGIEVPEGSPRFEMKPYTTGALATDRTASPPVSNRRDLEFGLDVKYGVTQNLTADFTYNPDFAQVEVDEQQVNLTRFSLFFPEKREFFLEGRGIFDFGVPMLFGQGGGGGGGPRPSRPGSIGPGNTITPTIFYSRQIGLSRGRTVPLVGGGRLTGKVGRFSIGAVNIQTDEVPGSEPPTNFSILRVKRDIARRSRIGMIFTRRSQSTMGDGSNAVYGADAAFAFYDNVNVGGFYTRSRTPGLEGNDTSYQAAFNYTGDRYGAQLDHLFVGNDFNPEVGFLRREDFRRTFAELRFSPRPRSIQGVRQFSWTASLDYILNGASDLETRLQQLRFSTEFENGDRLGVDAQRSYELLVKPFSIALHVTIPIGGYGFQDVFLSYSLGPRRRMSGDLSFQRGSFFGGTISALGYSRGRLEVTRQLSLEPSISINRIDLPQGLFTARLITTRVTYTFTPRMFFSGLLQYNSSNNTLGSNLRFRWEYSPGSELFVVYTDQRDTSLRGVPLLQNRAFIVKINRLFRF